MIDIKNAIEELLSDPNITNYQIEKATGIRQTVLGKYTRGESKIGNMSLDNAIKLYNYYLKLKEENEMRTWEREGYIVQEVEFDGDLHEFEIVKNGEVIATITPADTEDMERIIADLDAGEDVNGWEDGMGNTIVID
jgi:hypothetical protein